MQLFVDTFIDMLGKIANVFLSHEKILGSSLAFAAVFIMTLLLIYFLIVKKKPQKIYEFLFKKDQKLESSEVIKNNNIKGNQGNTIYDNKTLFVLSLSIFISILWNIYFWNFVKDDAFITFRYAKNLAEGYGVVFNKSGDPVEGCSNFLWILLSTIPHFLNLDVVWYTKILCVIFGILTIIMVYKFSRIYFEKNIALIAPLIYSFYYPIHLWTVGGLETPLLLLLIVSTFYCAHNEIEQKVKFPKYSILFGFLYSLARIDGIGYILAFESLLILYYLFIKKDKELFKQRIRGLIIFSIFYGVYFIWRWQYFGYLFPNNFYVKQGDELISMAAIRYISLFLGFSAPIILFMLYGFYHISIKEKNYEKMIFLAVPIIVNLGITLLIDQFNAGQGFRYILPAVPFIIVLGLYFFRDLKKWINLNKKSEGIGISLSESKIMSSISLILIISMIIIPISAPIIQFNLTESDTNEKHYQLATWFDKFPENTTVAFIDMGILPYYSELEYIDMWGLMDEYIAQNGFSANYVLSRDPEFIIFKIWGPRFEENQEFQERYSLFYQLEFNEMDQYLQEYQFTLDIYKLNSFEASNESLAQIFA